MWIDVKDKLPSKDGDYLVVKQILEYQVIDIASFTLNAEQDADLCYRDCSGTTWFESDSDWGTYSLNNVTHWMPLPALPET